MPRKLDPTPFLPPSAESRLRLWGRLIREQRVATRVTAKDFCTRVSVSPNTLRRMESGDPAVSAGSYLIALFSLGILDQAMPQPEERFVRSVLRGNLRGRVRQSHQAAQGEAQDDYF